jgi:hypothetical protein
MSEWQDMTVAPRDGTCVLVVEEGQYFIAWWSAGWTRAGDDYDLVVEPSHWQPLPPYPAPINQEKQE